MSHQNTPAFTESTLKTPACASAQELELHLQAALAGLDAWRRLDCVARATVVCQAAQLLRQHAHKFAHLIALEQQTFLDQAYEEVMLSADTLDDHAMHTDRMLALLSWPGDPGNSSGSHPPSGVLVGVTDPSASLPLYQLARFCGPSLMAASVVMVLHTDRPPPSALAFESLWRQAGGVPGVYTNVGLSCSQASHLTQDPRVDRVVSLAFMQSQPLFQASAVRSR